MPTVLKLAACCSSQGAESARFFFLAETWTQAVFKDLALAYLYFKGVSCSVHLLKDRAAGLYGQRLSADCCMFKKSSEENRRNTSFSLPKCTQTSILLICKQIMYVGFSHCTGIVDVIVGLKTKQNKEYNRVQMSGFVDLLWLNNLRNHITVIVTDINNGQNHENNTHRTISSLLFFSMYPCSVASCSFKQGNLPKLLWSV